MRTAAVFFASVNIVLSTQVLTASVSWVLLLTQPPRDVSRTTTMPSSFGTVLHVWFRNNGGADKIILTVVFVVIPEFFQTTA